MNLQMKHGMAGIGIYWCLVEMAYENGGIIPEADCERIAFELRTEYERITSVLRDFELFYLDGENYKSESVDRRLNERKNKSEKAVNSVNKRWENVRNQKINTNVILPNNESNTIKVNKSKVNIIDKPKITVEERRQKFVEAVQRINHGMPKDEERKFIEYWVAMNNGDLKMAFEKEKKFYYSQRLVTWRTNYLKNRPAVPVSTYEDDLKKYGV